MKESRNIHMLLDHVDLELVFGMLILEDVGYFSCAPVICSGGSVDWLGRASGDAEGVPE